MRFHAGTLPARRGGPWPCGRWSPAGCCVRLSRRAVRAVPAASRVRHVLTNSAASTFSNRSSCLIASANGSVHVVQAPAIAAASVGATEAQGQRRVEHIASPAGARGRRRRKSKRQRQRDRPPACANASQRDRPPPWLPSASRSTRSAHHPARAPARPLRSSGRCTVHPVPAAQVAIGAPGPQVIALPAHGGAARRLPRVRP